MGVFAIAGGPVLSMLGNIIQVGTLSGYPTNGTDQHQKGRRHHRFIWRCCRWCWTAAIGGLSTLIGATGSFRCRGAALLGYTAWKVWGRSLETAETGMGI